MNIFEFVVFLFSLIVSSITLFECLYYYQGNSYSFGSLFYDCLKFKCIEIFLIGFMLLISIINILLSEILVGYNIVFIVLVLALNVLLSCQKIKYLNKLKYTKRICRQIVIIILLMSGIGVLYYFVSRSYYSLAMALMIIVVRILFVLSAMIIYPIEKLIGQYYIIKCKCKLSKRKDLIKIGITGSFGKTSTKEILGKILSTKYNVLTTPKSFNTPMGITKTVLENLSATHKVFICEMGAKKKGEIKDLCKIVDPYYAIITSVGRQHTNTFGSLYNIYKTKKELVDHIKSRDGYVVFNLDNKYVKQMYNEFTKNKCGVCVYGKHTQKIDKLTNKHIKMTETNKNYTNLLKKHKLDLSNKNIKNNILVKYGKLFNCPTEKVLIAKNIKATENGIMFDVFNGGEFYLNCACNLLGMHNVTNILLAIGIAIKLGVDKENIKLAISKIDTIYARGEKHINNHGAVIINNGYNSNIDTVESMLKTLTLFDNRKKIVITPGLIECEDDFKYNIEFGRLVGKYADEVIIVKEKNRKALLLGLTNNGFDTNNIRFANEFNDVKDELNNAGKDSIYLIENDLPDIYR